MDRGGPLEGSIHQSEAKMDAQTEPGGIVVARREAADWERFAESFSNIADNVKQVIQGKEQEVRLALA